VVEGLDVIDKIATVETDYYDRPMEDVMIIKVVPVEERPAEAPVEIVDVTEK
jgi:hypothetical protein